VVRAGKAEGAMDADNLLKPMLARRIALHLGDEASTSRGTMRWSGFSHRLPGSFLESNCINCCQQRLPASWPWRNMADNAG
jgi:hypothetical protein